MKTLVPIWRFSAICRLSQKALRLYDEVGLLRPAWVDPDSDADVPAENVLRS